jgi:hypothetical protein
MESRFMNTATAALGAALLLQGCPSPNVYQTPRTTPKGKTSHTLSAEAFAFVDTDETSGERDVQSAPLPPSYTARFGLSREVDLGVRLANMMSLLGVDVKWNFVRGETVDVAVAPAFHWASWVQALNGVDSQIAHLHLPLLIGINVAEPLSVVVVPGITYGHGSDSSFGRSIGDGADGVLARLGFGINARITRKFAIQPEVTLLRPFSDNKVQVYTLGFGFNFGALPRFDDVGRTPVPESD